ncbi:hypothetical protein ACJ7VE_39315, partial [Streptomyces sp. PB17]|uniref:hypothetical protein n=1 Tax=Streptomyces sp. PB17 TaxID=3384158 RepID=UPI0038B55926
MTRSYATDDQYERWYMAECCRCGRRRHKAGTWPDGRVLQGFDPEAFCLPRDVRASGQDELSDAGDGPQILVVEQELEG